MDGRRRLLPRRAVAILAVVGTSTCTISTSSSALAAEVSRCVEAAGRAQELRDSGAYKAARAQLVICGREECPAAIRRDCVSWLLDVNKASPTIVVRAKDSENRDREDVRVTVDGEVVAERLDGRPIYLDPGPHVIHGTMPSGAGSSKTHPFEEKVIIQTGEKNRLIEMSFGTRAPIDGTTPPTPGTNALPWVIGGVGVLSVATSITFLALGFSERSDLQSASCAQNSTCPQSDIDAVHTKLLIGDIAAGVGVVGLGLATYLFLTRPPSSPTKTTRATQEASKLGVDLVGSSRAPVLSLNGRF